MKHINPIVIAGLNGYRNCYYQATYIYFFITKKQRERDGGRERERKEEKKKERYSKDIK